MKNSIYLISVLMLALLSCKKEGSTGKFSCSISNHTAYLSSPDLINCKYVTGTYWVFLDSVNFQKDSIYVKDYSQGFLTDIEICNNKYEYHMFETKSSRSTHIETYIVVAGGLFKHPTGPGSGTRIYNDYTTTVSLYNFIVDKFDSISINNQYYYNVLKVTIPRDGSEQNNKSIYYSNSDYGFLRHEIYQDTILSSNKILIDKGIIR